MLIYFTAYLASKSGWSEQEIRSMPFYKVLLYYHCYNVMQGYNTAWLNADATAVELDSVSDLDNILLDL